MIIPWKSISPDTLTQLLKEYIIGNVDDMSIDTLDFDSALSSLRAKLENETMVVEWSELNETVTLVESEKYKN